MISRRVKGLALLCGSGLLLVGCQSPSTMRQEAAYTVDPSLASFDLEEQHDTKLSYLLEKYDGDGDGRIARSEYDRESDRFDRLDSDEDGFITDADFRGGDAQVQFMASRVLAGHFQTDDVNEVMTLEELESALKDYDTDADGTISDTEFTSLAADRKVALPGDDVPMIRRMSPDNPYETLVSQADENGDGSLETSELITFFEANAEDGEMTIQNPFGDRNRRRGRGGMGRRGGRGGRGGMGGDPGGGRGGMGGGRRGMGGGRGGMGSGDESEGYVEPTDGAMLGDMAPDFALQPPNGGKTVTLSSFRNNLPVALIFGSYT